MENLSKSVGWTENPRVGGSIPPLATNQNNGLQQCRPFVFSDSQFM